MQTFRLPPSLFNCLSLFSSLHTAVSVMLIMFCSPLPPPSPPSHPPLPYYITCVFYLLTLSSHPSPCTPFSDPLPSHSGMPTALSGGIRNTERHYKAVLVEVRTYRHVRACQYYFNSLLVTAWHLSTGSCTVLIINSSQMLKLPSSVLITAHLNTSPQYSLIDSIPFCFPGSPSL